MKTLLVEPHPNVVRLLGCCTAASDKEPTYLIMEYVAKGKLQEFLRRYASVIITNDRVRISQVRQRLVSSCQVSVSSCPAQTQDAKYAQKKYSQSCIFKAHIFTS